jgi:hypothetical protein
VFNPLRQHHKPIEFSFFIKRQNPIRQLSAERTTNSPPEYGENPGTLFTRRSQDRAALIRACYYSFIASDHRLKASHPSFRRCQILPARFSVEMPLS